MNLKDSYAARRPRSLPTSAVSCARLVFWATSFHAVFASVVDMLKMLSILVGIDQKDSSSLVVFFWQWHVQGWFAGHVAPRVVFPWLSAFVVENGGSTRLVLLVTMHITSACRLFVGSGTAACVLVWTRMLTCPFLCSTDARYRRAENCGAPQLQFVDQVEPSLFGNRDMYAQCICAVCSWQGGVFWSAEA